MKNTITEKVPTKHKQKMLKKSSESTGMYSPILLPSGCSTGPFNTFNFVFSLTLVLGVVYQILFDISNVK